MPRARPTPLVRGLMVIALAVSAMLLAGATAPRAEATVVPVAGHALGVWSGAPMSREGRNAARLGRAGDSPLITYHGGPVLHASAPYLVLWDPARSIPAASESLLVRYFSDVARGSGSADNVYSVLRQYTDSTGAAAYRQTFQPASQAILDTTPYPSDARCADTVPSAPICLSDADIITELNTLIASRNLPTGLTGAAPIYFVVLPPYVDECTGDGECAAHGFCGYHSYFTTGAGLTALYAVIPTLTLGTNPKSCQWDGTSRLQEPNGLAADATISTISHEDSETITNPLLNAWYEPASDSEIADVCAQTGAFDPAHGFSPSAFLPRLGGSAAAGNLYDMTFGSNHYYVQTEWSEASGRCEAGTTVAAPKVNPRPGAKASAARAAAARAKATAAKRAKKAGEKKPRT